MKLYFSKGACSLVPRIIINELNLPCDFESVDLLGKKTKSGIDYYTINAKGSVPALEIKAKEILTENAVILQYLADSNQAIQLLPSTHDFKRYRVLEWLNYVTTELHKGFGPLFNPEIPQEVKDTIFIPALKFKFNFVNQHLENHLYLMGDHFTLPDAYLFVMLIWAHKFNLNSQEEWKNLARYFNELKHRKSVKMSLEQEGLLTSQYV